MASSNPSFNTLSTERDLAAQQAEFERLSRELAERELELATLEAELSAFERRYVAAVGPLIAELDRVEQEIAAELLRLHPRQEYRQSFQRASARARASQEAVNEKIGQEQEKPAYIPSDEMKELFRRVAKAVHPDLAANEAEHQYRTDLMARANVAYKNGDRQALEQILYEWEHRDEKSFTREEEPQAGGPHQADRLDQKIARVRHRLEEIQVRLAGLKKSDLHRLMLEVQRADREGRDLLGDMARELQVRLREARKLLDGLKQQEKA